MDPVLILLLVLLGFMVIGSLLAVETRDLLSSVICVGAVGFGTSVVFLLLGAPDLAITQVVVEVLVLVVLVRVVITRRDETYPTGRSTLAVGSVLLVLGILVAVVFAALGRSGGAGLQMRPFGQPLVMAEGDAAGSATAMAPRGDALEGLQVQPQPRSIGGAYLLCGVQPPAAVTEALARRDHPEPPNAANYVAAVILDYRAYDTLGEATVIFVAILGAYAVLRQVGRTRHPEPSAR
jgi:multisubunit Na+/H+ antiporter MnhB subunit